MQAKVQQPQRAPDGAPIHCERHRPKQTTLYRLVQQHAATFFAEAEAAAGADLPQFVKGEFDAFLESGILAHGCLRLRCGDCGHDKLVAFRRGEALLTVLHKIITRTMKLLTRRGVLVEEEGSTCVADNVDDSDEARTLRPLQAAACTHRPSAHQPARRC